MGTVHLTFGCKYQVQLFVSLRGRETPTGLAVGKEEAQKEENKRTRDILRDALRTYFPRLCRVMLGGKGDPRRLAGGRVFPKQVDGWEKP